ncbi:hypothetical protein EV211_13210 [Aminicella lysinilytica]|uniref:Uncharacterized protein n=1 Tax=Aminicella lysinilytica TaxID=433323 RepID=A0A4R6PYH8_9FIRM|nr:hypothetical protein EV211_13210 [Aminicella lysinilytica]
MNKRKQFWARVIVVIVAISMVGTTVIWALQAWV